jgi:hypothetical protein
MVFADALWVLRRSFSSSLSPVRELVQAEHTVPTIGNWAGRRERWFAIKVKVVRDRCNNDSTGWAKGEST